MHSTDSDRGLPQKPASETSASEEAFSQNEKFELLSAYLDGEVSEPEQRLVIQWLASDAQLQQHYHAQLKLRQSIQQLATDLFPSKPLPDQVSIV